MFKVVNHMYMSIVAKGRYSRIYKAGNIVNSEEGTLGLMIFRHANTAIDFAININKLVRILIVKPIGIETMPTRVSSSGLEDWLDGFYKNSKNYNSSISPPIYGVSQPVPGTICIPSLKVISELEHNY